MMVRGPAFSRGLPQAARGVPAALALGRTTTTIGSGRSGRAGWYIANNSTDSRIEAGRLRSSAPWFLEIGDDANHLHRLIGERDHSTSRRPVRKQRFAAR